jgi:hypothetical protein
MSRVRHDALSRSQQEWNQPQPFRIDFSHAGLRAECSKCRGGRVTWRFVGFERFMPTFRFECECGNAADRSVFNGVSGFPVEPASS